MRGTRETNRQAQETQQQRNVTRHTHQNPKKKNLKPQTQPPSLLPPNTNHITHRHKDRQHTTERHSSLQQWLQQDDMVASLEDEEGKKPVEREKDTHHVGMRSIFLCKDVCTCCTSSFDTTTNNKQQQ